MPFDTSTSESDAFARSALDEGAPENLYAKIAQTLFRRRWIILGVGLLMFSLTFASSFLSPRTYAATSVILINPAREQLIGAGKGIEDAGNDAGVIDSEIEVLRSRTLMVRIVDSLKLANDANWISPARKGKDLLRSAAGDGPREAAAAALSQSIKVQRRGSSFAVDITAEARSAELAAKIANATVDNYLQLQTESRFSSVERANNWFIQRLADLRKQVESKELAAEDFRVKAGISAAAAGDAGPAQANSADVQTMLVSARADLAEKEARLRLVDQMTAEGRPLDTIAGVLNSGVIGNLRAREVELSSKEAELSQQFLDAYPALRSVRSDLENVRQSIRAEVERVSANLRNEVDVARARLNQLQSSFGRTAGVSGEDSSAIIHYRELVRDAAAARAVYESLLERSHEVAQQSDLPSTTSRQITTATPPTFSIRPNLKFSLMMALIVGAAAGLCAGFAFEGLDRSIYSAEALERITGIPAIASIPMLRPRDLRGLRSDANGPADHCVQRPMTEFAEAVRVLRTSILHFNVDRRLRVVALTSAAPNEGKTTVALSLARIAALAGQKVVVVDCDLRLPSLANAMGAPAEQGLLQVLTGEIPWRSAVLRDKESPVDLIATPPSKFTPRDVFSSEAMARLMAELRANYELVILDCAPILAIAEVRIAIRHADATALVVRSEKTPVDAVREAVRELGKAGVTTLGGILTFVDPDGAGRRRYNGVYYNDSGAR